MADGISQELGKPGNLVLLIQMPLHEVVALLAETQLFFGNDTGMLNLSAACGTHSIGLFGHPISAWVANSSPRIHPIYPDAGLSNEGVSQIEPSRVIQALNQLELLHELEIGA
jgi:ADP-heptose:LPS heptosyltransferase